MTIRYYPPPDHLLDCIATIFVIDVDVDEGGRVEDLLFPEWATMRFHTGSLPTAHNRAGYRVTQSSFPVTGPQAQETYFSIGTSRQWAITFLPVGWMKLVGANARDYANAIVDGHQDPAFAPFRPLALSLYAQDGDESQQFESICRFLDGLDVAFGLVDEVVRETFIAIVDPRTKVVQDIADRLRTSQRTVERICSRVFGFSPKLLLRRQRFMRSLADFTVDPTLKWIGAMDSAYHDQAQFVRDFRQFMGMTPTEYAQLDKPILAPAMRARQEYARAMVKRLRAEGDTQDYGFGP